MKNTIIIDRNALQQQVDLRNYYMGEAIKRNDLNADVVQSNAEDKDLFLMFLKEACNELLSAVALRFVSLSYEIDKEYILITIESEGNIQPHIIPLLKQSINDYLVNELVLQWLLMRRPEVASNYISLRPILYNNVQQQLAKLSYTRKVRRRSTDLAGI